MTTPLSRSARAIAWSQCPMSEGFKCAEPCSQCRMQGAAALRAAADQVVPEVDLHVSVANDLLPKDIGAAKWSARYEVRSQLLTLATELEAH